MKTGSLKDQLTGAGACGSGAGSSGVVQPSPTLAALPPEPFVDPARNPALLYLASLLTRPSRQSQTIALRVVARLFSHTLESMPWHRLGVEHTAALRAYLAERYAPNTANRYLCCIRSVLKRARRLGLMSADELDAALDFRPVPGCREPPGRALDVVELEKLFAAARADRWRRRGARDAAVLALLYGGGLRREEVVILALAAYNGEKVRVRGKGNKERDVYLPEGSIRALNDWIKVRGGAPGPLVLSLHRDAQLSPGALNDVVERFRLGAGVEKFTPHDGRRSYATHLFDAGEKLEVVQDCMGHASPATTAKYRRDRDRTRRRSAKLLTVPY